MVPERIHVFVYFISSLLWNYFYKTVYIIYYIANTNFQVHCSANVQNHPMQSQYLLWLFIDLYACTYMFSVLQVFSFPVYDRCYLVDTDVSPLHTSSGTDELLGGYNVQQRPLWSYINQKVILYQQHSALNTFPLKRGLISTLMLCFSVLSWFKFLFLILTYMSFVRPSRAVAVQK